MDTAGFADTSGQDRAIGVQPRSRRKRVLIGVAAALVSVVLLGALLAYQRSAAQSVSLSRLSIATVERGRFVRDIAADGRVVAAVSPTLYAAASGTVTFAVKAGNEVREGDVLGSVDSPDLEHQLDQERSALQEFDLAYRRAQIDARRKTLQLDSQIKQAQIELDAAATEQERFRRAREMGVIPQIEVIRTQAALSRKDEIYRLALSERDVQRDDIAFNVDAARLVRDRKQLLVDSLQEQLQQLQLRSPVSGMVGQLLVAERTYVVKDTPLLTVIDMTAFEVEIQVPESFARDLASGMRALIRGAGREFEGEVGAVSPEVVAGEVTARVRFLGEAPRGLRQSQRMSARVLLESRDDVLTVARGPFAELGGGKHVYVMHGDFAERREVRLGATSVDRVEIIEGLTPGERVVISGTDHFRGAARVLISH